MRGVRGAKNIVPLLKKAEIAIVHGEKKENKPITNKWIRMFSPMIFNKGVYIATITIKESKKNIYSIASLKIDNGMSFNKGLSQKNNKIILLAPSIEKDIPFNVDFLSYFVGNVNQTNPKILFGEKEYEFTPESAYEKIINVANSFIDKVNSSTEVKNNSITSQQDAAYLDAVRRGDIETAQKMVNEAARKAGYTIKAYHGTPIKGITMFDDTKIGSTTDEGLFGHGHYFTTKKLTADGYATADGETMSVFLHVDTPWWGLGHKVPEVAKQLNLDEDVLMVRKVGNHRNSVVAPLSARRARSKDTNFHQ